VPSFIIEKLRKPDGIQCETSESALLLSRRPICLPSDLAVLSDALGKWFQRFAFCRTIQFEKNYQQFIDVILVHRFPAQIMPFLILYQRSPFSFSRILRIDRVPQRRKKVVANDLGENW